MSKGNTRISSKRSGSAQRPGKIKHATRAGSTGIHMDRKDDRTPFASRKWRRAPNSEGIVVAEPDFAPRNVTVADIRRAVREVYNMK